MEDLSERAARILGDKADGSPVGDLTAALDEVEALRERVADVEERCIVLYELRKEAGSTEPRNGWPRWVVLTEDGDIDGYVWATSRGGALSAAHRLGTDGDFTVMEDTDR